MSRYSQSSLVAVLGPTNTGKTHLAIERMCAHSSGMIGFPLRLLAREVYDRVVALKGANRVALVTGEEKIIPKDAQWFLCTAEAMPMDRDFAFVAIDEAQIGIDPERGHIFTDRMLHARGRDETMILGSESLRPLIEALLPDAEIITRPRFSTLSYAGPRKLSRLPRRSAIVAFSVEDVYAIAEMLRRQHGGAAIVMGSLSPQTRNAQVKMYQDGEVDYLVATDAIGMGLNLDVTHVAFAALKKFDGSRRRRLTLAEIGQIAGRAGRHQKDGSFGVLSGLATSDKLQPEEIENLESHRFPKLEWLYWRNAEPDFASVDGLIRSLEEKPQERRLHAAPEAVDLAVLKRLAQDSALAGLADSPGKIRSLWEAACIPDFRKVGADHQARFIASLWPHLAAGTGKIPHARMAQEISRLENVQGDIGTLGARIAAARSWSYIAQKPHWVEQPEAMIDRTRALESRLSDAMHALLTQRFVDKRTRVLMRGLLKDTLAQDVVVDDDGTVLVEGQEIGTLKGFQFLVPSDSRREDRKMLLAAAERYLGRIMTDNADALAKAPDSVLALVPDAAGQPAILWGDSRLAVLSKGKTLLQPEIRFERSIKDMAADDSQKVIDRVKAWVDAMKAKHLQGLMKIDALANDPETPAAVRALFAQIVDAGGILSRREIDQAVRALDNDMRGHARRAGLVFGALDIFHHALMKPGAVLWRTALFAAYDAKPMIDQAPDNAVHLKPGTFAAADHAARLGFRKIGDEYIRVDMVERLIKQAHEARQQGDIFAVDPALATSLGLSPACHEALLALAGFVKTDDQPAPVEKPVADVGSPPHATADKAESVAEETVTEEKMSEESASLDDAAAVAEPVADAAEQVVNAEAPVAPVQYWRWKGMARKKPGGQFKSREKHQKRPKGAPVKRKVEPVLATAGGAFAELAALRDSMKK
ncbi:helicase-related protein [Parasphingorhabdus sp.]|uniref:helicase-related protein n=1 Tax=Parasphingorhabdus sp. TaxID=2709688 RepID=UPI002B27A625|nr:helicase-related protein [Parasphingorhabdus sp.]